MFQMNQWILSNSFFLRFFPFSILVTIFANSLSYFQRSCFCCIVLRRSVFCSSGRTSHTYHIVYDEYDNNMACRYKAYFHIENISKFDIFTSKFQNERSRNISKLLRRKTHAMSPQNRLRYSSAEGAFFFIWFGLFVTLIHIIVFFNPEKVRGIFKANF